MESTGHKFPFGFLKSRLKIPTKRILKVVTSMSGLWVIFGRGAQNPVVLFKNQESDTALLGSNVDGSGSFQTEGTLSYELRNGSNQVVATGNWGAVNLGPINLTPLLPPLLTQTNM